MELWNNLHDGCSLFLFECVSQETLLIFPQLASDCMCVHARLCLIRRNVHLSFHWLKLITHLTDNPELPFASPGTSLTLMLQFIASCIGVCSFCMMLELLLSDNSISDACSEVIKLKLVRIVPGWRKVWYQFALHTLRFLLVPCIHQLERLWVSLDTGTSLAGQVDEFWWLHFAQPLVSLQFKQLCKVQCSFSSAATTNMLLNLTGC